MTVLFLIFALATSAAVYFPARCYLRAHPPRNPQAFMLGAFLIQSAICVWIGFSLGQMSMR